MNPIDPVTIFILLPADGFTRELSPGVAPTCADPDLWGYLAKCRSFPHDQTWLHAAAALGHTERFRFL